MIESPLVGKTINIIDEISENENKEDSKFLYLLKFFCPDYEIVNGVYPIDSYKSIIYVGEYQDELDSQLRELFRCFINTVSCNGKYDYDFNKREHLLDIVYSKWGLVYNRTLDRQSILYLLQSDYFEFCDFIKKCWYSRTYCFTDFLFNELDEIHSYLLVGKSFKEIVANLHKYKDDEAILIRLEYGIVDYIYEVLINGRYKYIPRGIVEDFKKKFDKGHDNKRIIYIMAIYRKMQNRRYLKLLWLLHQLQY